MAESKTSKRVLSIVIFVTMLFLLAGVASAALSADDNALLQDLATRPNTIQPSTEEERSQACEVHVTFEFDEPEPGQPGGIRVVGTSQLSAFLKRLTDNEYKGKVYMWSSASVEGGDTYNADLADRRQYFVDDLVYKLAPVTGDYSLNLENQLSYTLIGETDEFWPLSSEETTLVTKTIRRDMTRTEMIKTYKQLRPLIYNRRVILSTRSDYMIDATPGVFYDGGCPAKEPEPELTCGDGIVRLGIEDCEPPNNETPDISQCPAGNRCNAECKCESKTEPEKPPTPTSSTKKGTTKWWWLLLLLIPLLFWVYRTRRIAKKDRVKKGSGHEVDDKKKICEFLGIIIEKKKEVIGNIRELEEVLEDLGEKFRKRFAEYCKNFRDIAFLRDPTSKETKLLDQAEEKEQERFADYMQLVIDLLELEQLEVTLRGVLEKIRQGIDEQKKTGTSETLLDLDIHLTEEELAALDKKILPVVHNESGKVLAETTKIGETIQEHTREVGFSLSGFFAMARHKKEKEKLEKEYGEEAQKVWWIKKNLKFHAPLVLRDENRLRTPERHIWPFRTTKYRKIYEHLPFGKWAEDEKITTEEGSAEEQEWKKKIEDLWGEGTSLEAKSAHIQQLGMTIGKNVEKDRHMLESLFKIVKIDDGKTVKGVITTGNVKGDDEDAMRAKGLKTGGALQEEIKGIEDMIKIICLGTKRPIDVKITTPLGGTSTDDPWKLIAESKDFVARIHGGVPPFKYIWHWGPNSSAPDAKVEDQVGGNLQLTSMKPLTDNGTSRDVKLAKGFQIVNKKAEASGKKPFDNYYSIAEDGENFPLQLFVIDAKGQIATDQVGINVTSKGNEEPSTIQVIDGTVIDRLNEVPVPGATVWVTHAMKKGGEQIDYEDDKGPVFVTADREGKFHIEGAFMHDVTVNAQHQRYSKKGKHTDPEGNPHEVIEMKAGEKNEGIIVPLEGAKVNQYLEGTVKDRGTGKPVSGAAVYLTHSPKPGDEAVEYHDDSGILYVQTDDKGRFVLKGTFKHNIVVHASHNKFKEKGKHTDDGGKPTAPIELKIGRRETGIVVPLGEVSAEKMQWIEGYVADDGKRVNGKRVPVPNAKVWITYGGKIGSEGHEYTKSNGERVEVQSDGEGFFRIGGHFRQNIIVRAEKNGMIGKHTDPDGNPAAPFMLTIGETKKDVIVPLVKGDLIIIDKEVKLSVIPAKNPNLPHPPEYGAKAEIKVPAGGVMRTAKESYKEGIPMQPEIDFMLMKGFGELTIGWVCYIQQMASKNVIDPRFFNLRVIGSGVDMKNPDDYKEKGYIFRKIKTHAEASDENKNQIYFHPYIDIPQIVQPGKYRIYLKLVKWPKGLLSAMHFKPGNLLGVPALDHNWIEFEIEGAKVKDGEGTPPPIGTGTGGGNAPCEDKKIELKKIVKDTKEKVLDLERKAILDICNSRYRDQLLKGDMTMMNNLLYNSMTKKHWKVFKKKFLPEGEKIVAGVKEGMMMFNDGLLKKFDSDDPMKEFVIAVAKHGGKYKGYGNLHTKDTFEFHCDNSVEQLERINKNWGKELDKKFDKYDKAYVMKIQELEQKNKGKNYRRYTFKWYPEIVEFLEKVEKMLDELCI